MLNRWMMYAVAVLAFAGMVLGFWDDLGDLSQSTFILALVVWCLALTLAIDKMGGRK